LRNAFSAHGTVESVRVLRANKCAFVNFTSEVEALKVLRVPFSLTSSLHVLSHFFRFSHSQAAEEMNGAELGGQTIVINFQWAVRVLLLACCFRSLHLLFASQNH
jgi:hypothetical protein